MNKRYKKIYDRVYREFRALEDISSLSTSKKLFYISEALAMIKNDNIRTSALNMLNSLNFENVASDFGQENVSSEPASTASDEPPSISSSEPVNKTEHMSILLRILESNQTKLQNTIIYDERNMFSQLLHFEDILKVNVNNENVLHTIVKTDRPDFFITLIDHVKLKYDARSIINNTSEEKTYENFLVELYNTECSEGNTPLILCIVRKNFFLLQAILTNIPFSIKYQVVNYQRRCDGRTAMHISCFLDMNDIGQMCRLLYKHGADLLIRDYSDIRCQNVISAKILMNDVSS